MGVNIELNQYMVDVMPAKKKITISLKEVYPNINRYRLIKTIDDVNIYESKMRTDIHLEELYSVNLS